MGAAAVLTISKDGKVLKTVPIENGAEADLGRGEGCVIRIQDRAISRSHAILRGTDEGVQIERKSEFAPLSVNGAECTRALLKEGDVVSIGPYLMKLRMEERARPPEESRQPRVEEVPLPPAPAGAPQSETQGMDLIDILPNGENEGAIEIVSDGEAAPSSQFVLEPPFAQGGDQLADSTGSKTALLNRPNLMVKLLLDPGVANVTEFSLDSDEIVIGRAKSCDIILTDDSASVRNSVIVRRGLSFIIRDLGSSNGTFVNGERVTEQEISGGDIIRIGGADIKFVAENGEWEGQQRQIEALPPMVEEPPPGPVITAPPPLQDAPHFNAAQFEAAQPFQIGAPFPGMSGQAIPGIGGGANANASLLEKFRAMPKRKQMIYMFLIVAAVAALLFGEEDGPPVKKTKGTQVEQKGDKKAGAIVTFESLSPEQKRFVETQHQTAFDAWNSGDYDKSLYAVEQIFRLGLADFKSAREIESYSRQAKQRLSATQEERKKREEEVRIKARIQEIADGIQEKLKAGNYDAAKDLLTEIITLSPDNPELSKWKSEIEQHERDIALNAEKRRIRGEIIGRVRAAKTRGDKQAQKGEHLKAIATYKEALAFQPADSKVVQALKNAISASRAAIADLRDPLLKEAAEAEEAGEQARAYQLYRKAATIDPAHPEPYRGIGRVRGTLHEKAKALYTEAVMAESYSDLSTAKKRFEEVLKVAPEDDVYHERARRRLVPYIQNALPEEVPQ